MTEAYPLAWPEGWPRTAPSRRTFNYHLKRATFSDSRNDIFAELRRLGAKGVILSTNVPLRQDGLPYANQKPVDGDPGVAVYFTLRDRQMSMARDSYDNVTQNMRSLAMAIEHLRGLERHGGAQMLERAFSGFAQLPPPAGSTPEEVVDWREEFGPFPDDMDNMDILALAESRYRRKAKEAHSDAGGSDTAMIRLNLAIKQAREELVHVY